MDHATAAVHAYIAAMLTSAREFRPGGGSVILGPDGSCWNNARQLCRLQPRLSYVEGIVLLANGETSTHAFAVDQLGRVVEATAGFESAERYRGVVLDLEEVTAWERANDYGKRRGFLLDRTFQALSDQS